MPVKSTTKSVGATRKRATKKTTTKTDNDQGISAVANNGAVLLPPDMKVMPTVVKKRGRPKKIKPDVDVESNLMKNLIGGIDDDLGFGISNFAIGDNEFINSNSLFDNRPKQESKQKVSASDSKTTKKSAANKNKKKSGLTGALWKVGIATSVAGDTLSSATEDFYNIYKQNTAKAPTNYSMAIDNSVFGQYRNHEGTFKYVNNWTNIYKTYKEPDTKIKTLDIHNKYLKLFGD
ncbi:hypothetical protein [Mycoplasma bradburyae]|uniref:Uncharacterized protein n=1 Tax=Mycoplasma bradburyae TaxID=2963128 RepID=A0AAW6HPV6_9MOLU|nr:hypothetical protein [Mycoplasma bradburyae]MDC4183354.1 hypothetical protein [Mycoplasma bradburyae]UTS71128.1 hypothetical protein NMG77_01545 [Mycoplasma bradburyae]